jgi:hypothetical protein
MKLPVHLATSTIVSTFFYFVTKSFTVAVVSFLSGIFIDLDHLIDYFYTEGKIRIDIKDFFYKCENFKLKKAFLFLHSYEIIVLLVVLNFLFSESKFILGFTIGYMTHLLLDISYNFSLNILRGKDKYFLYFLTYRILKKFELKKYL